MSNETFNIVDLRDEFLPREFAAFAALYDRAFSDPSEREDPADWRARLTTGEGPKGPVTHLLVARPRANSGALATIAGGHVFEYYPESSCGLLTYIVVDDPFRRQGCARQLFEAAVRTLQADARTCGRPLRAVFGECEDPRKVADPAVLERIEVFSRLGAKRLDIPYVQPSLQEGANRCRHLILFCMPLEAHNADKLSGCTLTAFLHEFYQALGIAEPDRDSDYRTMIGHLGPALSLKQMLPLGG